ncbi:PREDICTED: LOW QUALITY PROTEIN: subtilisin-like protease SBT5.6 [Tarenaya hassleriana]|uniref:LOW QUALITY PROTEIN: subtilisin-like protease SBT5.6 n=1 Tax=Tarenaya hassleriana TaxID=28532 RepID=UPI0008FD1C90|nr:PREDICTED: LOW QUALITY PROTEIN: subtilisin-like protease SBT5.6 [Tarenaya hassleriana]
MKLTSLFLFLLLLVPFLASCDEKQVYIVYFGEHRGDKALHEIEAHHHSYLLSVKDSEEEAKSSLLYSYKHSINGFAAKLTAEEASRLKKLEEVVSVFKSHPRKYEPHTTRSWRFVGLEEDDIRLNRNDVNDRFRIGRKFLKKAKYGDGIIVGVLDSGVWPESKSFRDKGIGPIPKSWKGICQNGTAFDSSHCNRYYVKGYLNNYGSFNVTANKDFLSPRDPDGHGSHTPPRRSGGQASTAVGRRVSRAAAIGGFAGGTASGGAQRARLAVYKACWAKPDAEKVDGNVCFEEDMLAAIDDAIADGVHVISVSIGSIDPLPYSEDGIAIGALHAVRRNIVVAASAGNYGPKPGTLSNPAPWIITVGASGLDRSFVGGLVLGNGFTIKTESITSYKMDNFAPLVYAADVVIPGVVAANDTSQCLPNSLSPELVKGKVVMCMRGTGSRVGKSLEVKRAGGAGLILGNSPANGDDIPVDAHFIPAAGVIPSVVDKILHYIKTDKNPVAFIKPGKTVYRSKPAPFVTGFSSRGPNVIDPNILKPDISAPGLNILAAWSGADSPTKISADRRTVEFNLFSGTSMSCPHVSGAIALIKAIHPSWSSAAIRSAIMTTAWMTNDEKKPIQDINGLPANPFAIGSGHFRPTKAADPGLVYDASYKEYLLYCCSVSLTDVDPEFKCPKKPPPGYNLNYPSISIPNLNRTVKIQRRVTNVGSSNGTSTYFFSAKPPLGVSVTAKPNILTFSRAGQKKRFTITVKPRTEQLRGKVQKGQYIFGRYTWTDSYHVVRSPIAVSLA